MHRPTGAWSVAVAARTPGEMDVFAEGGDGALWHRWLGSGGWRPWESLGALPGGFSGLSASGRADGSLDVVVTGADNFVHHKWWDSLGWHAWESLGAPNTAGAAVAWDPQITGRPTGEINLVVLGNDGNVWHRWWDGSKWMPDT